MWWGGGGGAGHEPASPDDDPANPASSSPIPISWENFCCFDCWLHRRGRAYSDSLSSSFGCPGSYRKLQNMRHQMEDQEELLGQIRDALETNSAVKKTSAQNLIAAGMERVWTKGRGILTEYIYSDLMAFRSGNQSKVYNPLNFAWACLGFLVFTQIVPDEVDPLMEVLEGIVRVANVIRETASSLVQSAKDTINAARQNTEIVVELENPFGGSVAIFAPVRSIVKPITRTDSLSRSANVGGEELTPPIGGFSRLWTRRIIRGGLVTACMRYIIESIDFLIAPSLGFLPEMDADYMEMCYSIVEHPVNRSYYWVGAFSTGVATASVKHSLMGRSRVINYSVMLGLVVSTFIALHSWSRKVLEDRRWGRGTYHSQTIKGWFAYQIAHRFPVIADYPRLM